MARADFWFDEEAAAQAVEFFSRFLKHQKGEFAGKPLALDTWQVDEIIRPMFGWRRPDGTRRYRTVYVEIPRKNGKTTIAAGIGLYLLFADKEQGAEIYSAAADRDQAAIAFDLARSMVEAEPALKRRAKVYRRSIVAEGTGSSYKVLSADARSKHGFNAHGIIFDEIHAQPNRELYDVLHTSTGARRQPVEFLITTAGVYEPESIAWQLHDYATKVRDGAIDDPTFLPVIYGAPSEADYRDPAVQAAANPGIGVSVKADYLLAESRRAEEEPSYENTYRRLHLNQWCVAPDTMVRMADGSQKRADAIVPGDVVEAFDETTGKLVRARVVTAMPMEPTRRFRITTSRGRSIETNGEHPFWNRTGKSNAPEYGWKKAADIAVGDRLAVALGKANTPVGGKRLRSDVARFLGIYAGDGGGSHSPRITSVDPEVPAFVSDFVGRAGDRLAVLPDGVHFDVRHQRSGVLTLTPTKRLLKRHGMWGQTCETKRVPPLVFTSGPKAWASFLSGYLDTDGHVSDGSIVWVSKSRGLLEDCQHLLSYLDIQSKVSSSTLGRHRLEVLDAASFDNAARLLTPLVARKAAALLRLSQRPRRDGDGAGDRRAFDRVVSVDDAGVGTTIGIEVERYHTHITNGLITHNTQQVTRWIRIENWEACKGTLPDLAGRKCFPALDLSTTTDITALALLFPPLDDEPYCVLPFFWCPEDTVMKASRRDRVPYDAWVRDGFMTATPGNVIDYAYVRRSVNELSKVYKFGPVAFDPWNATQLATQLGEEDGIEMVEFRQGMISMNEPAKEFERLVVAGKIMHPDNPVLNWMAANVAVKSDAAGNIKPDKDRSTGRIDGIVATIMGVGMTIRSHAEPEYSISFIG